MQKPNHDIPFGHIEECQICGAKGLEPVINLGHQPLCDSLLTTPQLNEPEVSYPLALVRCPQCSLVQLDYVVPGDVVYYPDYPYRTGITRELFNHHQRLSVDVVERHKTPVDSLVVDIGSNDGTLLKGFARQGMRVLGVEPTNIAQIAVEDGIDTVQDFFGESVAEEIVKQHGKAKVITATNMFAHIANLGDMIRGIEVLLDDDGVFVLENHYLMDIVGGLQFDSIYHEHLRSYSIKPLVQLFGYYGLSVVDAHRVASYGGSVRVYVVRDKIARPTQGLVNMIAEERDFGLYDADVYNEFRSRALKAKRNLYNLALEAESSGVRFVGNSCPGRASTLLNYVGLGCDLMPYIAEQPTSLKLGRYLPGLHQPVVNNSILFSEQPEYVVLLAWHYWEPIRADLRKRGLKSKFVLPLPELRIIED
ncbi:MAG: class I SAM-dependent methyltransferase [Rhodospirillaceae bacterium]|nr:class I SAM-dependent methyltransferase [Rhodospirillaceae bacterium]